VVGYALKLKLKNREGGRRRKIEREREGWRERGERRER
jgi:hypothetical protein